MLFKHATRRVIKIIKYHCVLSISIVGLIGCESGLNQSLDTRLNQPTDIVKIGGHLALAIVVKKNQQDLNSLQLLKRQWEVNKSI